MAFGLKLRKFPKPEIQKRVNEAAGILGLEQLLDRKPKALSGGQRQRVAVGRAIVRQPKVFLFDEPLSNLDAKMRVQMRAPGCESTETLLGCHLIECRTPVGALDIRKRSAPFSPTEPNGVQ